MAANRPNNHVTRDLAKRLSQEGAPCPDLTETMVSWLEATYPPRCLDPTRESVEEHLMYGGKVALIASLRAQLNERHEGDLHLDPTAQPADRASA